MSSIPIALSDLNALGRDAFVDVVGPVFEGSPWIAERTWERRPFSSRAALHEALCRTMYEAAPEEQVRLIQAHPDLVGRAAREGTLTPESTREQAGLGALSPEEIAKFDELNDAYRRKYAFPFVICARENKKETILTAFPERLKNSREDEIATALHEISKIAMFRLMDLVSASVPERPLERRS